MKRTSRSKRKHVTPKTILRLPDLEVAKSAVLNSLSCPDAQRGYRHAIKELMRLPFIGREAAMFQPDWGQRA